MTDYNFDVHAARSDSKPGAFSKTLDCPSCIDNYKSSRNNFGTVKVSGDIIVVKIIAGKNHGLLTLGCSQNDVFARQVIPLF